jgi:hypothetical protein
MQSTQDTGASAPQPSPRTFRLHRSDDRDLLFEGHLIGHAERNAGFPDRPVKVSIYATQSGKYVTHIERGALVMGGSREAEGLPAHTKAGVHDSPDEALQWLLADNKGKLGAVSKAAWTEACRSWTGLQGRDVELI